MSLSSSFALAAEPAAPPAPAAHLAAVGSAGHSRVVSRTQHSQPRVDLVIAGARGQVGSSLCRLLSERQAGLRELAGVDLCLLAGYDRHGLAFSLAGLPAPAHTQFRTRAPGEVEALLEHLCGSGAVATVFVDCTASDEVADGYPRLLASGVGLVCANKRANARDYASWQRLQRIAREYGAPYRYETTVGAAIPLLGPLRDLRLRGERVLGIEGLLSGSLSHILHRVHEGCAFSEAVAEARALGFTEPDPMEDLCAVDLSRKLLVLARECGFVLEPEDLEVEPLVDVDAVERLGFDAAVRAEDQRWRERIASARESGERWVVLAQAGLDGARVATRRVPANSPFANLPAGQNLVCVRTSLQDRAPLVLGGPGAGPDITAAGLLSDIVAAARELSLRGSC